MKPETDPHTATENKQHLSTVVLRARLVLLVLPVLLVLLVVLVLQGLKVSRSQGLKVSRSQGLKGSRAQGLKGSRAVENMHRHSPRDAMCFLDWTHPPTSDRLDLECLDLDVFLAAVLDSPHYFREHFGSNKVLSAKRICSVSKYDVYKMCYILQS